MAVSGPGQSEDCLDLDIYAPRTSSVGVLYPVMVWIHGSGAFRAVQYGLERCRTAEPVF